MFFLMKLDFFAARMHCWLMFNLFSTKIPTSLSAELLSSWSVRSMCRCLGLFLSRRFRAYWLLWVQGQEQITHSSQNCKRFWPKPLWQRQNAFQYNLPTDQMEHSLSTMAFLLTLTLFRTFEGRRIILLPLSSPFANFPDICHTLSPSASWMETDADLLHSCF